MKKNILLITTLTTAALTSSASLFVSEPFATGLGDYTADASIIGQNPTVTGFSGAWTSEDAFAPSVDFYPQDTGLSYANLPTTGGSLEHFRTGGGPSGKLISRNFDFTAPDISGSSSMYMGFLFNFTSGADFNLLYDGNGTADRTSTFSLGNDGAFSISLAGGVGSVLNFGTLTANTTNLILLKVSDNTGGGGAPNEAYYDVVEGWINPDLTNLGAADQSGFGILSKFGGSNIDTQPLALSIGSTLSSGESYSIDEFFVADSLAAIPEPSSIAVLAGALSLGLVFFRRRK